MQKAGTIQKTKRGGVFEGIFVVSLEVLRVLGVSLLSYGEVIMLKLVVSLSFGEVLWFLLRISFTNCAYTHLHAQYPNYKFFHVLENVGTFRTSPALDVFNST